MWLPALGAPALDLQQISAMIWGVFDGFRYFTLLPLYPQNYVLSFLGKIQNTPSLPPQHQFSGEMLYQTHKFCLIHLLSQQQGLQTLLLLLRGDSCSPRSSGCDLVRSHKPSVACCDHCWGRIPPGENTAAL